MNLTEQEFLQCSINQWKFCYISKRLNVLASERWYAESPMHEEMASLGNGRKILNVVAIIAEEIVWYKSSNQLTTLNIRHRYREIAVFDITFMINVAIDSYWY